MKHTRRISGFTLIELLTVLAVISVLTTIGVTLFFRVGDQWRVANLRLDLGRAADNVFSVMRQDLGRVMASNRGGVFLRGEEQHLETPLQPGTPDPRFGVQRLESDVLVAPIESVDPQNGLPERHAVMYHIDRSSPVPALVRTLGALDAPVPSGARQVLAEGVTAMRVEFYDGEAWRTGWAEEAMPKAVRVSLAVAHPNRPWEQVARKAVFDLFVP